MIPPLMLGCLVYMLSELAMLLPQAIGKFVSLMAQIMWRIPCWPFFNKALSEGFPTSARIMNYIVIFTNFLRI